MYRASSIAAVDPDERGIDRIWDIKGKVLNAPVWQLMGGLVRDKIKPTTVGLAAIRRMLSTALKRYAKSASIHLQTERL